MVDMTDIVRATGAPRGASQQVFEQQLGLMGAAQGVAAGMSPDTTSPPLGDPSVAPMAAPAMTGMQAADTLSAVDLTGLRRGLSSYMDQSLRGINDPALRAKYQGILTNSFSNLFGQGVDQARVRTTAYQAPSQELMNRAQAYTTATVGDTARYAAPSSAAANRASAANLNAGAAGQGITNVVKAYEALNQPGDSSYVYDTSTGSTVTDSPTPQPGGDYNMSTPVRRKPNGITPLLQFNLPSMSRYTGY